MNLETAAQVGTFLSAIAAVVAIGIAIRTYRRQTNAQVFIEYTARYERVMESFPIDARGARLDLEGQAPEASEQLTLAVLRYLNLCSEEFYLCRRGYLAKEVWSIWEAELRRTLRSPLVRREWKALRGEFQSYPEFLKYVEEAQREAQDSGQDPIAPATRRIGPKRFRVVAPPRSWWSGTGRCSLMKEDRDLVTGETGSFPRPAH